MHPPDRSRGGGPTKLPIDRNSRVGTTGAKTDAERREKPWSRLRGGKRDYDKEIAKGSGAALEEDEEQESGQVNTGEG